MCLLLLTKALGDIVITVSLLSVITYSVISSNQSSSSLSLKSCEFSCLLESASGLLYLSAGIYINSKVYSLISYIQQFSTAIGCKLGVFNIPLIYFASTSTISLLTPVRYSLNHLKAINNPYSSSFT